MGYVITLLIGLTLGAGCCAVGVWALQQQLRKRLREVDAEQKLAKRQADAASDFQKQLERRETDLRLAASEMKEKIKKRDEEFARSQADFQAKLVSYHDLQSENRILKTDLRAVAIHLNKSNTDTEEASRKSKLVDDRSQLLARKYLAETIKSVVAAVGPTNYSACKKRLLDAIGNCRNIGFDVSDSEESHLIEQLRREFELAVRAQIEREEQSRIKAQIREEEVRRREIERELKQSEREQAAIRAALDQALAAAKGEFNAEVQRLQAKLAEAEEKAKRTMSMAQQTKQGHVYVISNVGSLGEGVFKIGMTRRLIPVERIQELSCAAVPFPFDVHMMISCKDAPALENVLHKAFNKHRINKANPRKEFFRIRIEDIYKMVLEHHGEVEYKADPEALEYRQSVTMPEEDALFIDSVYEDADEEEIATGD
jgi:hypothetical protein